MLHLLRNQQKSVVIADQGEIKDEKVEIKFFVDGFISWMDKSVDLEWVRNIYVIQTVLMIFAMVFSIMHMFKDGYWSRLYMSVAIILSIVSFNMNYLNFPFEVIHYFLFNLPSVYFLYCSCIWTSKASSMFKGKQYIEFSDDY